MFWTHPASEQASESPTPVEAEDIDKDPYERGAVEPEAAKTDDKR